mgnify:CR=1 FL=1
MNNNIELKPVNAGWGPNKRPPLAKMPTFSATNSAPVRSSVNFENIPRSSNFNSDSSATTANAVEDKFCDVNSLDYENYESAIFKQHILRRYIYIYICIWFVFLCSCFSICYMLYYLSICYILYICI